MNKQGSVLGGILLIAGSCIGAGMLALPVVTGLGGFGFSSLLMIFIWLFMTTTAFLLLEVNLAIGYELSLITLAQKTLGPLGKWIVWASFIFLFYSLSIAYIAVSGPVLQSILYDFFGIQIPSYSGGIFFTLLFGIIVLYGTRMVDYFNRLLMVGLAVGYIGLVILGASYIKIENLGHNHLIFTIMATPIVVISFGFHNMIPSMAQYFKGDVKRLAITLFFGSLIPLLIYLIWEVVMLGIIPTGERSVLLQARDQGHAATEILRGVVGNAWVTKFAHLFALFAIITSFLAQSLSLLDFLADGFKVKKEGIMRFLLTILVLAPPLFFAMRYPTIFIQAINLAGGLAAVVLFGIIPVLMVWSLRSQGITSPLLPAGKSLLMVILLIAIAIFSLELAQEMGVSLMPKEVEVIL